MDLQTWSSKLTKIRSSNSTDSQFATKSPTTTKPSGDGVTEFAPSEGGKVPNNLLVLPFGAGDDDTTFSVRVLGWSCIGTLWVPMILCEYSCTLSAAVGVANADVTSSDRFADTLSLVANMGNEDIDTTFISPANNTPAHFLVDIKGCQLVELTFDMTGATSGNALIRGV